jgi:ABC-type multidrug transport system fused ATPase/permease subunit
VPDNQLHSSDDVYPQPILTFAILPLIPLFLIARQHFRTKLSTDSDTVQTNLVEWNSFLEEHISSVLPIQLLGQEGRQERRAFRLLAQTSRSYLALFKDRELVHHLDFHGGCASDVGGNWLRGL